MKKKFILAACMAAFACACQQKSMQNGNGQGDDQNFQERRMKKQQNNCCEMEKSPVPQENAKAVLPQNQKAAAPQETQQTVANPSVAAPEVKVEKPQ